MNNVFFHFTAKRFVEYILKDGITRGVMVKNLNPPQFIYFKQWLTRNPDFQQSWAVGTGRLPYKRNEIRLTVEIPLEKLENCKPWTQMKFLVPNVAKDLSAFGDPDNWWIYQGTIDPKFIIKIDENPNQ